MVSVTVWNTPTEAAGLNCYRYLFRKVYEVKGMDHGKENRLKIRAKRFSYRQVIFFCLAGLMTALTLLFLLYVYFDFREECRESALRKARNTADHVAGWTDDFFTSHGFTGTDVEMSVWEQGVEAQSNPGEGTVVLDSQGEVVFSSDQRLEEFCWKALEQDPESPILRAGGGTFLAVGISESEIRGWNCFVFRDVAVEAVGHRFPFHRFLLLFLSAGICCLAAAVLIYRPIDRLLKSVDVETGNKKSGKNELEFLSGSLNELKDDRQNLQKLVSQTRDRLQEMFTLRLIRGDVALWDEYEEYIKDFGLQPWHCFVTVVAVLNLREEEEAQSNIKEDAICLEIVEGMPESLKKLAWMQPVYNACAIVAILGDENEELLLKRIETYCAKLQKFSETVCGYRLLMGVSAIHGEPRQICLAYRESVNAMTRSGSGNPSAPEEALADCHFFLTGHSSSETPYDASFEKNVQQGIKNMDKAQCYKAANEFFRYLSEESYGQDETMVYVLRFVDAILLTAMEIKVDVSGLYPDGLRRLYDDLMEVLEPSRERRYIKKYLIDPILEARSQLMEQRSYSLLEDIEQLIRENRGDISLAECADRLGVHTTYIWKIMKAERGKTFSDFLEEYKLEEAKRLLLNTNMTVADIASTLNYTNAQNFIRFFSKSTGMTPGKFRKLY